MNSATIFDTYQKADYITPPKTMDGSQRVYKYRDPIHYVEFLDEVHTKGYRQASQRDSMGNDTEWAGAPTLEAAFLKYRQAEYDKESAKKSSNLILKMRQGVKYTDTGDDISVPEFLAGSREHWIEFQNRDRKKRPVLSTPIMLSLGASANVNEKDISRVANVIVNKLYEYQIKCPKFVITYLGEYIDRNGKELMIFIEVPYFDFNSLHRFSFSSTFRRITFVNYELVDTLSLGYGTCPSLPIPSDLRGVIPLDKFVRMSNQEIEAQMDTIITNTFKK